MELHKVMPKGRGIPLDALDGRDMADLMSQVNSEPHHSLRGATPLDMPMATVPGADGLLGRVRGA